MNSLTDTRRAEIAAEERARHTTRTAIKREESDRRWREAGKLLAVAIVSVIAYAAGRWAGLL